MIMLRSWASIRQTKSLCTAHNASVGWNSARKLTVFAPRRNEESTETTQETTPDQTQEQPLKTSRRRRQFRSWVEESGARFTRPALGTTNYLDESKPFPNNPFFKPRPPLTDNRRQEIYDTYMSDPDRWTIRALGAKFKLSIRRVEAVLKLKSAEKELEANGTVLQKDFTKHMEQLMCADAPVSAIEEPLVDVFPKVGKPTYATVEEDGSYTVQDAATTLGVKPLKQLELDASRYEESKFTLKTKESKSPSDGEKCSTLLIVDTSK